MRYPILVNSPIFKGIGEGEMDELLRQANARIRTYKAGAIVALSEEEIVSLVIILSGEVRGEMMDMTGKRIKIEDIAPPMALAAAFMFGPGSRYPVNVVANIDTEVLIISKSDFMVLMQTNKTILSNYLAVVCSKALFLSGRLKFLSFRTIRGKLAHYILNLPLKSDSFVHLDKTQEQLADYFGVARPSLARALAGMQDDAIVKVKNREVQILNWQALVDLTRE